VTRRRVLTAIAGLLFIGGTAAPAHPQSGEMAGKHTMDGEVTKVDNKKGWIDVKTSEGAMKLHFPPDALANVKKGDAVSVELGLKDNGPAPKKGPATTK